MCGIVGMREKHGAVDLGMLRGMTSALQHRGPDDDGEWCGEGVAFRHRRLSIIDLAGSIQPMTSVDETLTICFNGEIFNYQQVRAELDYPFRTNGDTEVVLATFARYGAAGISKLRGQFAFAIHSSATGETWLFRDPVGVLPLYYYDGPERFAFASEIKAVLPAVEGGARIDESQLPSYLMRTSVPAPATLYEGVRKLPAGHYARVAKDGTMTVTRYWSLPAPGDVLHVDDAGAIDLVEQGLRDAISEALVADVPVGSYLSGGVDSSLIVAIASEFAKPRPLETFSAGFGDPRHDETAYARQVSGLFGTTHHEVQVRPADFERLWPLLTWHRDAPMSQPADVAVYRLAQTAREHVKVALSGEGSDELFGGYPKYRYASASRAAGIVPAGLRRSVLSRVETALPASKDKLRIAVRAMAGATTADRLTTWFAPFTAYEASRLLGVPVPGGLASVPSRDPIDLLGRLDLESWLPDNLLERGDRMSMAASLEVRPPFLDHRLVRTAFQLPSTMKMRDGTTKWVVKQVAARVLPEEIVNRKKVGFKVPIDEWLRSGLRTLTHDLLLGEDSWVAGVLDRQAIGQLISTHESGRRNEEHRLWTLLSLEVWARQALAGGSTTPPAL
ncbi:MAG: Asparagine synthetase [Frankiales bacterium]|nr:Asparagine synthetase [Frankiales bacterium]